MTTMRATLRLLAAASGARLAYAALTRVQPGGEQTWTRTNHRGEPVTLFEGPAVTVAAAAAALAVPGLDRRARLALGLAAAGAGALGGYDDLAGGNERHGFHGHLGALARGEVTTGAIKIAGIGATGLAAGILLDRRGSGSGAACAPGRQAAALARVTDVVINTGLVAASANLVNLFDLRPGRAIKVALLASLALGFGGPEARAAVAAPAGAAAALLPEDLGERSMLGDSGANALGAMLGVAAASLPRRSRVLVLGAVTALTAASEKISFTSVIARTPALNWLDILGRRPAPPAAGPPALGARPTAPSASPEAPGASPESAISPGSETKTASASAPAETSRPL
jgi:UDP-N-acetylmuramyl pentapeptide phosphotransferase/UDP-N-acetylglucosamine-1-phosphate transferase